MHLHTRCLSRDTKLVVRHGAGRRTLGVWRLLAAGAQGAVARYRCDRIAVMYMGKIVEMAETEELLRNPLHPFQGRGIVRG